MNARAKAESLLQTQLSFTRYDVHVIGREAAEHVEEAIQLIPLTTDETQAALCRQVGIYFAFFMRDRGRALTHLDKYSSLAAIAAPLEYADACNILAYANSINGSYKNDCYLRYALRTYDEVTAKTKPEDLATLQQIALDRAFSLRLLAHMISRQGNIELANSHLDDAINLINQHIAWFPDAALDLAECYYLRGVILITQKPLGQTEPPILEEAKRHLHFTASQLQTFARLSGKRHPLEFRNRALLGRISWNPQNTTDPLFLLEEARTAQVDCFGTDKQIDVAVTLHSLGQVYAKSDRAKALEYLHASLKIKQVLCTFDDSLLTATLIELAELEPKPKAKPRTLVIEPLKPSKRQHDGFRLFQHCTTAELHQYYLARMGGDETTARKANTDISFGIARKAMGGFK